MKPLLNKAEVIASLPPVGFIFYKRNVRSTDRGNIMSETEFERVMGYEPMWFRGTYKQYIAKMQKSLDAYDEWVSAGNAVLLDRIVFEKVNKNWSKSKVLEVESQEDFREWANEQHTWVAEYFKNYV